MDLLTWLIVGLVAGVLASMIMGGTGFGIVGDIIIGIAGAFVGSWVLRPTGNGRSHQRAARNNSRRVRRRRRAVVRDQASARHVRTGAVVQKQVLRLDEA